MSLAPNLFERRFQDLMEIGRAQLSSLAPAWTDYNAHDPGITLMEVLAWTGEAQLYALSRMRRDERASYAALLGLAPGGTQAAAGILWSDPSDPNSPLAAYTKTSVLPADAIVHVVGAETPTFRPAQPLLMVPGATTRLEARSANGKTIDLTISNARGAVAFLPFGESAGPRDVLALHFVCRDEAGLFGARRADAKGALWAIGVRAAAPVGGATAPATEPLGGRRSMIAATLVTDTDRVPVSVAYDSTQGMLTTGALLLDVDGVTDSPREFTIEFRSANGFARPPRVLHIEPNVVPISQGHAILREPHDVVSEPDFTVDLEETGLRFAAGAEPITLELSDATGVNEWRHVDRLADAGPGDNVYELDAVTGTVTFGNGINGRVPPAGGEVLVSYQVSDGALGRVARNRTWNVTGFEGTFGVNLDPVVQGADATGLDDLRREARRRSREDHALVSGDDISEAVLMLPLLEVARAWVPDPASTTPRSGVVRLIAMRSRPGGVEPESVPETRRWLDAVGRQLTPRMPLGSRLSVTAPAYVPFSIATTVEADEGRDPSSIQTAIASALAGRLALVETAPGVVPRQPGVPVTSRDIGAWMLAVDGVNRVLTLQVLDGNGKSVPAIDVPRSGLPRWLVSQSSITAQRAAGASR